MRLDELMAALKKKDDDMKAMEERYKMYLEKARNVSPRASTVAAGFGFITILYLLYLYLFIELCVCMWEIKVYWAEGLRSLMKLTFNMVFR